MGMIGNYPTLGAVTPDQLQLSSLVANAIAFLGADKKLTATAALTFDGAKLSATSAAAGALIQSFDTQLTGSFLRFLGDAQAGNLINWKTGSALRFATSESDFASFSELGRWTATGFGIGTNSPSAKLHAVGTGVQTALYVTNTGANLTVGYGGGSTIYADADTQVWRNYALSELMRLNLTGLGIGTSSVGARIHAYSASGNCALHLQNGASTRTWKFDSFSDGNLYIGIPGVGDFATFAPSGSLGLGGTPSAWVNTKALQINSFGSVSVDTVSDGNISLSWGAYATGASAWKYTFTGLQASKYTQVYGTHQWHTAPAGTAGNAISFTQAMTLDASGNLVVGGTTAYSTVTMSGNFGEYFAANIDSTSINASNKVGFRVYELGSAMGEFSYARDGSGRVVLGSFNSNAIAFSVNDAERVRIDSSGRLLTNWRNGFINSSNEFNFAGNNASSEIYVNYAGAAYTINIYRFMNGAGAGAYASCVASAFTPSSDYRVKTDVEVLGSVLSGVLELRPVTYAKEGIFGREHGLIAHEAQGYFPNIVRGEKDAIDEDGDIVVQTVDYMGLTSILVKAIQEQQALIESLTARITALEN